jgi:D-alanyl-D-alanine carboxypeptidase/D-alanyl-D-alanine-endopeptidase (penicillin-binding protein 4)
MIVFGMLKRARRSPSWAGAVLCMAVGTICVYAVDGQKSPLPGAADAKAAARSAMRPDVLKLEARIDSLLGGALPDGSHPQRGYWGILIADRDTGETLYSKNEDHFFTPASNAKIFTTALALATLGPDFRFRTTLESKGALGSDGSLGGDLLLVGRGDPDLSNRKFPYDKKSDTDGPVDKILGEMADAAVAKGLKEIDGDVVGDDSYFPYDPYPEGWSVGDLFFRFGAPVSAIAFNDNTFSVEMRPGANLGVAPAVTVEPAAAADTFGVELEMVSSGDKSDFAVVRQPGTNFLLLRGTISPGHAPMRVDLAMPDPVKTAAGELKGLLEARGVRVTGGIRVEHGAPPRTTANGDPIWTPIDRAAAAGNSTVFADHLSQPLIEVVRITNKVSQNLHAELLLRTVGHEKLGTGSTAAGLKAENDFLKAAGIADGDVLLADGSGLSRDDLVTPRAVVALLKYAVKQPWGAAFFSTLPVSGVDGTLENRMKNSVATGLIEAKTGAADHARGLSGYATTRGGEYLVFSIFVNNNAQHGTDATGTLDAIATAMSETLGATVSANSRR